MKYTDAYYQLVGLLRTFQVEFGQDPARITAQALAQLKKERLRAAAYRYDRRPSS